MLGKIIRYFILGGFLTGFIGALFVSFLFYYHSRDLPKFDSLDDYNPPQLSRIFAHDGSVIGEIAKQKRTLVPIEEIPPLVLNAFVASEDAGFYQHEGLDFVGLVRAVIQNTLAFRITQGASTITQQTVKNLFLTNEQTASRKISEAILTYRFERNLTKKEILYLYVNEISFGNGRFGVVEAARFYFGKTLSQLDAGEIAYLAGMIQSQYRLALNKNPKAAKKRQLYVLGRMLKLGYIDKETYNKEVAEKLIYTPPANERKYAPYIVDYIKEKVIEELPDVDFDKGGYRIYTTIDPDMQEHLTTSLRRNLLNYDKRHGYRKLEVLKKEAIDKWKINIGKLTAKISKKEDKKPTLAYSAESGAKTPEAILKSIIYRLEPEKLYYGFVEDNSDCLKINLGEEVAEISCDDLRWSLKPAKTRNLKAAIKQQFAIGQLVIVEMKNTSKQLKSQVKSLELSLAQIPEAQSAMLAISPKTHEILAMRGGFSFRLSDYNRVMKMKRQPGSSFKPFVYLTALREGKVRASSVIKDEPVTFKIKGSKPWSPKNFSGKFKGEIRIREALANSVNTVAAKLIDMVGPKKVIETAKQFGIKSKLRPHLSLALGSSETSLLEMVNSYSVMPAMGRYDEAYMLTKVIDSTGRILYRHVPDPRQAIAAEQAGIMVSLMQSVVTDGTSKRALTLKRPVAGKTGTTNDQRDAWFIGYSADLVCGVWVGFDERRTLGWGETGSRASLPGFVSFMKKALLKRPVEPFAIAPKLVYSWIDPVSGFAVEGDYPGAIKEVFLPEFTAQKREDIFQEIDEDDE